MKTPLRLILALAGLAALAAGLPAAERFDRTKARIDALLGRRLHPPALPEKPANPFAGGGAAGPESSRAGLYEVAPEPAHTGKADPVTTTAATSDEDILASFASQVKINGQLQINGQPLLIINQSPYKEGDLVQMHAKDGVTYFLRVVKIGANDLTLGYNEAVVTIPIRN